MIESLLEFLASFIITTIETTGYTGIAILSALESANIPIPSEIILPFSGFLVFKGTFNFFYVVLAGTFGNLVGSLVSYYIGFWGGRPFLVKYGKFLLVTQHDLDLADRWFYKYGSAIIFASRVLPVVRTFISFPAGVAKMNIWKFSLHTFAGSLLWSIMLTYAGVLAGKNWTVLEGYFRKFDWAVLAFLVIVGIWWVWRHIKILKHEKNTNRS